MSAFLTTLFALQEAFFWRALTFFVLAIVLLALAAALREMGEWIARGWRLTIGSWWADRHARAQRKQLAAIEADMDAERQRLRKASITEIRR